MDDLTLSRLLQQIQYPGMPKPESDITRAWLRQNGAGYDKVLFNPPLGEGAAIQPGITGSTAQQFSILTKKRADMVAYSGDNVDIIEVKPRMSFSAVGQLLGYQHFWQKDPFRPRVRHLIAVAQVIDPDVQELLDEYGIESQQVNPETIG